MGDSRFKIKNGLIVESGPTEITGSLIAPSITGSLLGTASYSLNGGSFDVTGSTLYSLNPRSGPNFSAIQSIYVGSGSGFDSYNSDYSVFLGGLSGYSASNAASSSFLGYRAGHTARATLASNMIGISAGESTSNITGSNFIGYQAGYNADNALYTNIIGYQAGYDAAGGSAYSNFIGFSAGELANNTDESNFIGRQAGYVAASVVGCNFIGGYAGYLSAYSRYTNAIGFRAGESIGVTLSLISGSYNNMFGYYAGYRAKDTAYSTIMGFAAGFCSETSLSPGRNNIIIGTNISLPPKYENGINIGGLIFGSGSYGNTTSQTFSGSVDGKVGIGTNNPEAKLHVGAGNIVMDNSYWFGAKDIGGTITPVLYGRFSDNATYLDGGTGGLFLRTNDAAVTAMYLDNTGKVGVGTTSPLTKLDVRSGVVTAGVNHISQNSSTDGTEIIRGYYSAGALTVLGSEWSTGGPVLGYAVKPHTGSVDKFLSATSINIERGAYVISGNIHKWFTGSTQTVTENSQVTMGKAMTLTGLGNLGVGTDNPVSKLDVNGTLSLSGGLFARLAGNYTQLYTSGSTNIGLYLGGTVDAANYYDNTNHYFRNIGGSTTYVLIDNGGNVGIGTSSPAQKLHVVGQGYFTGGVRIGADSTNNLITTASIGAGTATLYIGNASINTTSDIRLKTNVVNTTVLAVETLSKLRVVDYNWQDPTDTSWNNRNARGKWTGLIAQEAIEHVPYVVNATRDPETMRPIEVTGSYWQLEYEHLVPILIKAIQEQQQQIEQLKKQIQ
jgi:hypothetical protein